MTRALIILVALALAATTVACGDDDEGTESRGTPVEQVDEQPLSPAEENGRKLFIADCGSCHTLDAAGTQGSIGPDLNELQVDEADVLAAIENGGTSGDVMPKNLVEGEDAQAVAAFVANSGP